MECFEQGLKVTERYFGPDNAFAEKFRGRKLTVGSVILISNTTKAPNFSIPKSN